MSSNIFLIDDDSDDRTLFCQAALEAEPAIICNTARNEKAAFTLLEEVNARIPDLIFLDINIPSKNGWDCLRKLKTHKNFFNIPVVMYSTSSQEADKIKTKQYGALGLFTKPADYDELVRHLRIIISHLKTNSLHLIAHKDYRWFTAARG